MIDIFRGFVLWLGWILIAVGYIPPNLAIMCAAIGLGINLLAFLALLLMPEKR